MDMPSVYTDRNYSRFEHGGEVFYFSYRTLIAFTYHGKRFVRQNDWSVTTGKHLNNVDGGDKKSRLSGRDFERAYQEAFGKLELQTC